MNTEPLCTHCKDTCICPDCNGDKCRKCHYTGYCPVCCQTQQVASYEKLVGKYEQPRKGKKHR